MLGEITRRYSTVANWFFVDHFGPTRRQRRTEKGLDGVAVVSHVAHKERILARNGVVDARQQIILIAGEGVGFGDLNDAAGGR
jgi:hypothetical protein